MGGGAREQPPTTLPFLPWEVWGVGQGGGRGGRGRWGGTRLVWETGEGAGQKRAGGPVVVLGHEGGTRAEGSEAWCQRACEQRTVHWFHRLPLIP